MLLKDTPKSFLRALLTKSQHDDICDCGRQAQREIVKFNAPTPCYSWLAVSLHFVSAVPASQEMT